MPSATLKAADREHIKAMLFDRYDDWNGILTALKQHKLILSRTSLERFFNGASKSPRTLRYVARLLHCTPESLLQRSNLSAKLSRNNRHGKPLRDPEAFRVAYQLWVELKTRKLGQPILTDHDIVVEIYDSWYAFFKASRELIKAIPLHRRPSDGQMRELIHVSEKLLNEGLRPHLGQWQARFRAWWANRAAEALRTGLSPQDTQKQFPSWNELSADLLAANQRLIDYLAVLEGMIAMPQPSANSTRKHRRQSGRRL